MPNFKLMDRIYSSEDWQVYVFKKWASLNGYLCKHVQGHREKDIFEINSRVYTLPLYIELDKKDAELFPYLDTFSFTKDFKKFKTWEDPGDFKLCSTRGDYRIKINGDYYDKNELVFSKYYDKWLFRNDAIEMPEIGYMYTSDVVYINDEPYLKWNCWRDSNGVWRNDQYKMEDILAGTESQIESVDTKKKTKKSMWKQDIVDIGDTNTIRNSNLNRYRVVNTDTNNIRVLGTDPTPSREGRVEDSNITEDSTRSPNDILRYTPSIPTNERYATTNGNLSWRSIQDEILNEDFQRALNEALEEFESPRPEPTIEDLENLF